MSALTPGDLNSRIDDSLHIDVTEQDEGDGIRLLIAVVHQDPEIHVLRKEQGGVRTPWNVSVPYPSQVIDREGDFESADAARAFAEALLNAAKLAKQLEVYGR